MKTIIFILVAILLAGCASIKQKTFRIVNDQQGGVISTSVDPSTMTVTPKIVFGTSFTSVTTIPQNVKEYECETTSYSWWTGKPIAHEKFYVKRD